MGAIHLDTLDAELIGADDLTAFLAERFTVLLDDPGSSAGSEGADGATVAYITTRRVDEPEPDDGRRRRTARTRRRIFGAATELFALHGYGGPTTEMMDRKSTRLNSPC